MSAPPAGGSPRRVALTIDTEHPDRPSTPGVIEGILDLLQRDAVPAFCFIQGRWALAYPELAARIATAGHGIGSHAHHHVPVPMLSVAGLRREIRDATDAIRDATGIDPRPWFRCPFGAGADHARTTVTLAEQGYGPSVPWEVDALDWDSASAREVEDRVVDGVLAGPADAIVLIHSWPAPTVKALPGIVQRLRDVDVELMPLAAIMDRQRFSDPDGHSPRS
jgi:peptidoglycan/xylan/chitin deacetylase (PgdA/CDA1 family)